MRMVVRTLLNVPTGVGPGSVLARCHDQFLTGRLGGHARERLCKRIIP